MSYYAKIENNIVVDVIVASPEFINSGAVGDPILWIETEPNTKGGVHLEGGIPLRKNYAAVGYTYDISKDAFIPPKPEGNFVLNEQTCLWELIE